MSARTSRLVEVLSSPEASAVPQFRTGVVRAVDTSGSPYTVDVDLDGVTVAGLPFRDGMDPEVGQFVWLWQQGPQLVVFGSPAPARVVVAEHNHVSPPTNPPSPPAPPAAPTAPAAAGPVSVIAAGSATWATQYGGDWRTDKVIAGGPTGQRGFWFYGTGVAAAKGAGTITAATVFIKRSTSGGVSGAANVRLGTHSFGSQPVDGSASLGNVATVGVLLPGQGGTFALTAAQVAALNAGADGVGVEPGSLSYTSADYLIAEPRSAGDWSGSLQLTVEG